MNMLKPIAVLFVALGTTISGLFGHTQSPSLKAFSTETIQGNTTGVASTTLLSDNNTFSGATTTINSSLIIGTNSATPTLGGYIHPYLRVGTTTCPTNPTFYGYFEVCGSDYTTNGVQAQIGNIGNGAQSFAGLSLLNDKSDTNLTNYGGLYINSTNYTDTTFGTAFAIKSQLQVVNTMGPVIIASASASTSPNGYINFITNGLTAGNEAMRITSTGSVGIGTTSPPIAGLTVQPTLFIPELNLATSTAMSVGVASSTQQRIYYGAANVTLTISSFQLLAGIKTTITTCGPLTGTGGAITWANLHYSGGVQPGNTTSANQCDMWYITATQATSSVIAVLTGMTAGIQ